MEKTEVIRLREVLNALDDLANTIQYQCIGIYGISDSFINESLARARKVSAKAKKELLEVKYENH
jgi:hypothetical protein